jgi:hypothetical protein
VMFAREPAPDGTYATFGEAAVTGWLRDAAKEAIKTAPSYDPLTPAISNLYASPADFSHATTQALARLLDLNAAVHRTELSTKAGPQRVWHNLPAMAMLDTSLKTPQDVVKALLLKREPLQRLLSIAF